MSEKRRGREPEVPEEEVPVAECLGGHAKHLPKYLIYKSESGCRFGEKCSYAHLIKYTTIGLRIPGYGAAEVFIDFTEEFRHALTDPMCKIHESYCASH